jgi:import inner membrane translocase subunit TIM10
MATPQQIQAQQAQMSEEERQKAFDIAKQEMEYRVDLFSRLTGACYDKCVDRKYREGELNIGENSCIDRCTSKYWQVRFPPPLVCY